MKYYVDTSITNTINNFIGAKSLYENLDEAQKNGLYTVYDEFPIMQVSLYLSNKLSLEKLQEYMKNIVNPTFKEYQLSILSTYADKQKDEYDFYKNSRIQMDVDIIKLQSEKDLIKYLQKLFS